MKKPENFNAGATVKKPNPLETAINNNFSNARPAPVETPAPVVESVTKKVEPVIPEEKEKKEKFLVSMAKGERANFEGTRKKQAYGSRREFPHDCAYYGRIFGCGACQPFKRSGDFGGARR